MKTFFEREEAQREVLRLAEAARDASIAAGAANAVIQERMEDCHRQLDKCHEYAAATNAADEDQWRPRSDGQGQNK